MAVASIKSPASRFEQTPLLEKEGRTFFGIWRAPPVPLLGDEEVFEITSRDVGQLDLLAHDRYGDRALFWAIAHANQIDDPPREVVGGLEVSVPRMDRIRTNLRLGGRFSNV